jgi:hypothetical protein
MKMGLQKTPPAWHAEAVQMLKGNFEKIHSTFCDATKRAVWLGFFIVSIKERGKADGSIPHGSFMPWLAKHLPEIGHSQVAVYQTMARNVAEKGKLQISDFRKFAAGGELPEKVLKLIEGKTQDQLMFSFKQVEDVGDGEMRPKRGRKKGEGGATKEQRALHKQKLHEMDIAERKAFLLNLGECADMAANKQGIGDPECAAEFNEVFPKIEHLFRFMQSVQQARKTNPTPK